MQNNFTQRRTALAVGMYDTLVGLWPLLSMNTFVQVTNLSEPAGLIKLLGASWATLGVTLLLSKNNRKFVPVLGVMSTLAGGSLALTECYFVLTKIISPIFLLQALCETLIGIGWILTLNHDRESRDPIVTITGATVAGRKHDQQVI